MTRPLALIAALILVCAAASPERGVKWNRTVSGNGFTSLKIAIAST